MDPPTIDLNDDSFLITTMSANSVQQVGDPSLRALLSRFLNKVLDRDPSFTRSKALALFRAALEESRGLEQVEQAIVDDEGRLLMHYPEMVDVIQTDFLFSLSELDQRMLFENYSSSSTSGGRVDAKRFVEDAGFPLEADPHRVPSQVSAAAMTLANNSNSSKIKSDDAVVASSIDISSILDESRKTSSEMNQFHDFIQSEIISAQSQYSNNRSSSGGYEDKTTTLGSNQLVASPSNAADPTLSLSSALNTSNIQSNSNTNNIGLYQEYGQVPNRNQGRGNSVDDEYIAKLELENRKLKEDLKHFNSEFFEEVEDMKYRYSSMQEIVSGANTRPGGVNSSLDFGSSSNSSSMMMQNTGSRSRDALIDKVSTFKSGSTSGNSEFFVNPARVGQFASISSSVPSHFSNLRSDGKDDLSKSASLKKTVSFEDVHNRPDQIKFDRFATVCEDVVIDSILHHPFGSDRILQLLLSKLTEESIKYSHKSGVASSMETAFVHISQVAAIFDTLQISLSPSDLLLFSSGFASDGKGGMSLAELLDTLTTITTTKIMLEKTGREAAMLEQKRRDHKEISLMKETQLYKDIMGEVVREILYNDKKSKYASSKISLFDSFLENFLDIDKYKIGVLPFKLFYRALIRLIGYSSNSSSNVNRGGSRARGVPVITRKKVMVTSTPFVVTNQLILEEGSKVYGSKYTTSTSRSSRSNKSASENDISSTDGGVPEKNLLYNSILSGRLKSFSNNETLGKKFLDKSSGLQSAVQHFVDKQQHGGLGDADDGVDGGDNDDDDDDFDNQYYENNDDGDGDKFGPMAPQDDFNSNFIDYRLYVEKLVEEFSSFVDSNGGFSSLMLFSKPFFLVEFEFVNVLLFQLELLSIADRRRRLLTLHYHVWNAKVDGGKNSIVDGYQLLEAVINAGFSISRVIRVQFLKSADLMNNRIDFVELIVILMSSVVNWSQDEKTVVLKIVSAMGVTLNDRRVWLLSLKKALSESRSKLYKMGTRAETDAAKTVAESIVSNSSAKDKTKSSATASATAAAAAANRRKSITSVPQGGSRRGSITTTAAASKDSRDSKSGKELASSDSTDQLLVRAGSEADLLTKVLPASSWGGDLTENGEDNSTDPCLPPMIFLRVLSQCGVSLNVSEEALLLDCLDSERLFKNYYETFWSASTGRKGKADSSHGGGNFSDILLSTTSGLPLIYYSSFISFCGRYCGSWTDMLHTTSLTAQITQFLKQIDDPVQELSELSKMFHTADQAESVTTLAADGGSPSVEATGFISKRSFLITCHRSRIFKDLTSDLLKKLVESLCTESTGSKVPYFKLILFVRGLISSLDGFNGDGGAVGAVLSGTKTFNRNAIVGGIIDQLVSNGRDHLGCIFPIRNWLMANTDYSNNIITLREVKILLKEFKVVYRSEDFDELVRELTIFSDDSQFLNPSSGRGGGGGFGSGRIIGLTSFIRLIQSRRNIWVKEQKKLCNKIKKLLTIQGSSSAEQNSLRSSGGGGGGGGSGAMAPQSQFAKKLMSRLTSYATITTNLNTSAAAAAAGGSSSNSGNAGSGNSAPSDGDKCHFIEADVFSLLVTSMGVSLTCNEVAVLCDYCDNDVEASKLRCEVILDVLLPCTNIEDDIENLQSDYYVDSADLKRGTATALSSSRVGTFAKQDKASVDQFNVDDLTVSELKALNILRTLVLKNSSLYQRKSEEWRLDFQSILDGFSCCNNGTSSPTGFVTTEDFESCLRLMNCIVSQDTLCDMPNYPGSKGGAQNALVYYRPILYFIFDPNSSKIKSKDDDDDDDFGIGLSSRKGSGNNSTGDSDNTSRNSHSGSSDKRPYGRSNSITSAANNSNSSSNSNRQNSSISSSSKGIHGISSTSKASSEAKAETQVDNPIPASVKELYHVVRRAALTELVSVVMQDALNGSTSINATIISDSVNEAKAMLMECFKQFDVISRGAVNARDFCIAISTVIAATNSSNDADNDVIFSTKEWKEMISYLNVESDRHREKQTSKRGSSSRDSSSRDSSSFSMSASLSSNMTSKAVAGNFGIDYSMFIDLLFKDEDVKTLLQNAKKNPKVPAPAPISNSNSGGVNKAIGKPSQGNTTTGSRKNSDSVGGGNENSLDLNINVNFKDSSSSSSSSLAKRPSSASAHGSSSSSNSHNSAAIGKSSISSSSRANKTADMGPTASPNPNSKVRFARTAI